jgi:hypothetical protein
MDALADEDDVEPPEEEVPPQAASKSSKAIRNPPNDSLARLECRRALVLGKNMKFNFLFLDSLGQPDKRLDDTKSTCYIT